MTLLPAAVSSMAGWYRGLVIQVGSSYSPSYHRLLAATWLWPIFVWTCLAWFTERPAVTCNTVISSIIFYGRLRIQHLLKAAFYGCLLVHVILPSGQIHHGWWKVQSPYTKATFLFKVQNMHMTDVHYVVTIIKRRWTNLFPGLIRSKI